ncbi:hypothetical protein R5R35_012353 [Gryllus longicercus]|uniref:26S proteasome non-ATPase regulatory subunit 5 n=1 Tax=Gryllus longicercus TaxID=2509291 RepID=A0AAN9VCZ5_9ORTH
MNKSLRLSNNKKREDRTVQQRYSFDPLTLESKNVSTAMLLMNDSDSMVIAQALAALDKFASKAPENSALLISLDILPPLLPLIEHSEIYVRRFATKLLAELSTQDETKKLLMAVPSKIPYLSEVLTKELDVPLQEFSSEILSELTKMHAACADILGTEVIDVLFQRIKSQDPDVQHNSAKVMLNLLKDPEATPVFLKSPAFEFPSIIRLLQSEYPLIQMVAIDVLDMLTKQRENKEILEAFRLAKGLEELMDILEMYDWKDLHPGILTILKNVADNPSMIQHMSTSNFIRRLLQYLGDINDASLMETTLDVLGKMATTESGRKMLMDNSIKETLLKYMRDENAAITRAACIAVANMMLNQQALEIFSKDNPLREIMGIIKNEAFAWETRHGAMLALCSMIQRDKSICELFLNLHQQEALLHILKQPPGKVPMEVLVTILHCFAVCAVADDTRMKALETDFIEPTLHHLESPDAQLCVAACFCLGAYSCEAHVRERFLSGKGPARLMECLKSPYMPVRQAAASLLQLMGLDAKVADAFITTGILDWMMGQKKTKNACPTWETAIETLFKSCLPAKFFYLGHIDIQDNTGEVFYVMKRLNKPFMILDELLAIRASPRSIMLVANFGDVDQKFKRTDVEQVPESQQTQVRQGQEKKVTLELSSSIIPLGFIRVGMHFERAMLFKVLADQVGIPCALVRGEYGRTWIEVAVPEIEPIEVNHSLHVEDLPKRLLKPNCVVDLMDEPGKLLKIGSFEAARYCALPSALI